MSLNTSQQLIEATDKANNILLATRGMVPAANLMPRLDGLGSALGLYHFLNRLGKKVDLVARGYENIPQLAFLPKIESVKPDLQNLQKFIIKLDTTKTKLSEMSYNMQGDELQIYVTPRHGFFKHEDIKSHSENFKYDLIIVLDSPDLESLGETFEKNSDLFFNTPIINIDHSPENENFGSININDLTASATAEVIYNHLENWDRSLIDESAATCLLTGLIAKTKVFQNIKSPKTFQTAGRLVALGADREKIMQNLHRNKNLGTFRLWGVALSHLKHDMALKFAWSSLTMRDLLESGGQENDLADVAHELILNSKDAETFLLLYEKNNQSPGGEICGLLFSTLIKDMPAFGLPWPQETSIGFSRFCLKEKNLLDAEREVVEIIKKQLYNLH